MTRSPTHEAARAYAMRGWKVFPIEEPRAGDPKSGKNPKALLVPNGWHDATSDLARIDAWWGQFPALGIGIALEPSNLVVLDVDTEGKNKDGTPKRGRESLEELEREIGPLPDTLMARTGSGGAHAFYQRDAFPLASSKIGFKPNLDLIVNGYVVAAPSPHYTGGHYHWINSRTVTLVPTALAEAARKKQVRSVSKDAERAKIGEGGRNDGMFRLACALRDRGLGADALRAAMIVENQQRFDPPLDEHELAEIAEKVLRRVKPSVDSALGAVVAQEVAQVLESITGGDPLLPPLAVDVAAEPQEPLVYYSTGIPQLDAMAGGGLPVTEMCGIVGPPSCGKSALVGTLCHALSKQVPVLHISTELQTPEMSDRYAALIGDLVWRDVRRHVIPRARVVELLNDLRVHVVGCERFFGPEGPDDRDHLSRAYTMAARVAEKYGTPPVVAIDHMGILASGGDEDRVRQRAGRLTMQARVLTQALRCISLLVYTTQRELYGPKGLLSKLRQSDDPSVFLATAKESGDIEYHCATILFTDVDKAAPGPLKPARLVVARSRSGDTGFVGMRAKLDTGKWWGDPAAATELCDEEARARTNGARIDAEGIRLYDIISRHPGRKWVEIQEMTGWGKDKAQAIRGRLLDAGRIQMVTEQKYNQLSKPYTQVTYHAVANKDPSRDVPKP